MSKTTRWILLAGAAVVAYLVFVRGTDKTGRASTGGGTTGGNPWQRFFGALAPAVGTAAGSLVQQGAAKLGSYFGPFVPSSSGTVDVVPDGNTLTSGD